ncbi:MAG: AzlC family ABC transporter permease [Aeromicrobium sp.]|uniref:AzlC family ABC transporter permease n=1 Tax=Aeromicrobium sp. TaxID=1871063 RepID=UPI003C41244D
MASLDSPDPRASFRAGLLVGLPFAVAGGLLSLSFGVIARDAGFSAVAAITMSLIVFAGSAQFASVAILAAGGNPAAAVAAASLMNSRFLPMGAALAPSLPGGRWKRAAQGQAVVDSSWAISIRPDGSFDRWKLFGTTAPQFLTWQLGTIAGAFGGDLIGDVDRWGLDAIYPAFFVAILLPELRDRDRIGVALAGAAIALALVSFTPPGVPVLVASVAALWGLRRRAIP